MANKLQVFGSTVTKAFGDLLAVGNSYRGNQPLPLNRDVPNDIMLFGGDGVNAYFRFDGTTHACMLAYQECPPLQAICNRRALAMTNGRIGINNSMGKPSSSSQAKKVLKLLDNPNKLQTRSQFLSQILTYIDLVGYAVVVPLRSIGYGTEMSDAESFWVVPATLASLESNYINTLDFKNGQIDYVNIGGVHVDPNAVMIITDINPAINRMVIPSSKIKNLEHPINNIIGALQSESNLIKQRGPSGILSNRINPQLGAPLPLMDGEKKHLQESFNRQYGFMNGQSSIILTTAAMEFQKTGFDYSELGLDQISTRNTKIIADTIGYPTPLLGILDSKYDNMEQADKALYTKFIIPAANNIMEQLGSYLLSLNDTLIIDFSHVPELQQDKVKTAQARATMGGEVRLEFFTNTITFNRMLALLEEDPVDASIGDKYYYQLKGTIDFNLPSGISLTPQQNGNNSNNNSQTSGTQSNTTTSAGN